MCARCRHPLARPRDVVHVDGRQPVQTFANPGGWLFEVVTVGEAAGVVAVGPSSTEFSWFPGRAWTVAACGGCGVHVGWRFDGVDRFFGLIRTRLLGG